MVKAEENGNGATRDFEPEQFRKMFIGGLTSSTSEEQLKEYYSQWGEIVDCVVMRDPYTKRSRGFGFVSYAKQSEVDAAMSNRPHTIDGKTIDPKRAVPRDQSQKSDNMSSKRLYVSGVREDHTEDMFKDHFNKYGNVLKVEIINDKSTGKPRGFAFISFDDYDAVDKCVLIKSHMVNNYRCDVKKALSKEEMAKVQQQDRERMDRGARSRGPPAGGRGGGWGGPERGGGYSSSGAWGAGAPGGGPGGYGGAQGGQWGPPSGARGGPYYGSGGYGGGGYGGGYGGSAPGGGSGGQGGWGPGGGPGSWQGSQGGAPSWGSSGGQGGWGGRGY